jgi:hypothetical protein
MTKVYKTHNGMRCSLKAHSFLQALAEYRANVSRCPDAAHIGRASLDIEWVKHYATILISGDYSR